MDGGRITAILVGVGGFDEGDHSVSGSNRCISIGALHLEPDIMNFCIWLEEEGKGACEKAEIISFRKPGGFHHHSRFRESGADQVTFESGTSEDQGHISQGDHLAMIDVDINKSSTASTSWEVDCETGIGEALVLQPTFDLDAD